MPNINFLFEKGNFTFNRCFAKVVFFVLEKVGRALRKPVKLDAKRKWNWTNSSRTVHFQTSSLQPLWFIHLSWFILRELFILDVFVRKGKVFARRAETSYDLFRIKVCIVCGSCSLYNYFDLAFFMFRGETSVHENLCLAKLFGLILLARLQNVR